VAASPLRGSHEKGYCPIDTCPIDSAGMLGRYGWLVVERVERTPYQTLRCSERLQKNTDSLECEPFLAAAVAVAEVFSEIAKPDEKGDLIVAFPDAVQERCSANFRQRMNGPTLLSSVLALPVGSDSGENIYFVSALMRASQQLCHSENPVQMGR
jgi:hypothetical protein